MPSPSRGSCHLALNLMVVFSSGSWLCFLLGQFVGEKLLGHQQTNNTCLVLEASQVALMVNNPPPNAGDLRDVGLIPGLEDPMEESMAAHSSILAWRIPWTEEPGRLQSMGLQRDMTKAAKHILMHD